MQEYGIREFLRSWEFSTKTYFFYPRREISNYLLKNWFVIITKVIIRNSSTGYPRRETLTYSMYYNYVLQSLRNDSLYIGYTEDLCKRVKEHNQGLSRFTKVYKPWKLIYYEACLNKEDAMRREKYLKKTQGQRLLKRRLKEYFFQEKLK